jgi:outer membrane protein assembly factor BamB
MTSHAAATALAAGCLLAGLGGIASAATAGSPWAQTDYNGAQSRADLAETTLTTGTVDDVGFLRHLTAPTSLPPGDCTTDTGFVAPVLTGGRLFAVANTRLVSYDAATGHLLWQVLPDPASASTFGSLAVADGLVIISRLSCGSVSDPDGFIQAFRADTGAPVWSRAPAPGGGPVSQLVVSDGYVVAIGSSAGDGQVLTVRRVSDGAAVWTRATGQCGEAARVLVVGGLVVASSCGSSAHLVAYHLASGTAAWSRWGVWRLDRGNLAAPSASQLFAMDPGGRLMDLRPQTGHTRLHLAGATSVLAVDGKRAYARCGGWSICAYWTGDGTRAWRISGGSPFATEAGGVLYLADGRAVRASTGAVLRHIFWHAGRASAVVVGEGRIAASLGDDSLSLYGLPGW